MQDESRRPVFRDTLPPAAGCRADGRRPRVGPCGERLAKGQMDFARGKPPTRRKTPPEAPFFPAFHTPGNVFAARNSRLCGKKQISFSKEIPFLPHKNARRGGEMFHTGGFPARFLTLRALFAPFRPAIGIRFRPEILSLWQKIPHPGDNPTSTLSRFAAAALQPSIIALFRREETIAFVQESIRANVRTYKNLRNKRVGKFSVIMVQICCRSFLFLYFLFLFFCCSSGCKSFPLSGRERTGRGRLEGRKDYHATN